MPLKSEFIEMLDRTSQLPGGEILVGLVDALAGSEPSVAVRLNRRKGGNLSMVSTREVPWANMGHYIDGERPRFTMDPAMHQGLYYVQDASSMVISRIVEQLTEGAGPMVYVDLCAAPGGKTTAAADALPDGSLVIANEFDRRRAEALRENVIKWGYPNVVVTQGDTARYVRLGAVADIVSVDAPCSGEGMMRKEEMAVDQWSEGLVNQCAVLQREILDNAWHILKPGGYLIYSTCTFNRSEDEENLAYIVDSLGGGSIELNLPLESGIARGIDTPYPAYRFLPGRIEGEGLFIAAVQKPPTDLSEPKKSKPAKVKPTNCPFRLIKEKEYLIEERDGGLWATPLPWESLVSEMRRNLNIIYAGIEIGILKGRDIVPSQALAMSQALDTDSIAKAEVDYHTAIAYLRGEAIRLDDAPRGFILLTFGGYPLGFVKNLGNRANNLYPSPWTIRTTHIPDCQPAVIRYASDGMVS